MTFDDLPTESLLSRQQTAKALTDCGIQASPLTLATKASRGGGPPYRLFGKLAIYRWGDVVTWALKLMGEPASNTSELYALNPSYRRLDPASRARMSASASRAHAARRAAKAPGGTGANAEPGHDK